MASWRIAGINFDHMHMLENLQSVYEHPNAEIVGICHENPGKMLDALGKFHLPSYCMFTDYRECMERTKPDIVILCPSTAAHGEWVQKIAPYNVHILMEKPFASSLAEADVMVAAMKPGKQLMINWPLAWYPCHRTAKRLVDEGRIGMVEEVHYYDGNRGPVHGTAMAKSRSWFYKKMAGGGSLQDYLGYGTTLGTWFHGGKIPTEVTTLSFVPQGLEVDEHSVTVARYVLGLSTFQTRWGTFTDPWTYQPLPHCGFVIKGTAGTIASYDYRQTVRIQDFQHPEGIAVPVDEPCAPYRNSLEYFIHCLENNLPIEGPVSTGMSRIGQLIVDSAIKSGGEKRTVPLIG